MTDHEAAGAMIVSTMSAVGSAMLIGAYHGPFVGIAVGIITWPCWLVFYAKI